MPYNTINSRRGRSRKSRIPSPPSNSTKSAYNKTMKNNKKIRTNRRTSKKSLRKQWANSLKGKTPLKRATSPRKQKPMDRYTKLKEDETIGITTIPNKIFTEAPPIDDLSKLRQILINKTESPAVIKLIKDDMVRILVNAPVIRTNISTVEQLDDYLHGDILHGTNSKVERLFTEAEIENYLTLFQMITKKDIRELSKSVFTNTY